MSTKMPRGESLSIWGALTGQGLAGRFIHSPARDFALDALFAGSSIAGGVERLRRRSVLVSTEEQLTAALAFIELDGVVRRMTICPPDFPDSALPEICEKAEVDAIVTDRVGRCFAPVPNCERFTCNGHVLAPNSRREASEATEWVLFTSGTTGTPKLVTHSLAALTGAMKPGTASREPHVWATFYDIRRYGGLQIFLRAMLGNASMVLSSPDEQVGEHLARLGRHGVTHISGTPSHWRRVLMSPSALSMSPRVVRLSGEIADQAVLDALHALYPGAKVGHAYASTEAGVGFEVNDGLAGFPASYLNQVDAEVEMRVEDGCLYIRSNRTAGRYLGQQGRALVRKDGFVCTGDTVEQRDGRYYFTGRKDGVINVGGQKVHPEEVETIINRHPSISMSLVKTQKNPITGAIVVADVVLKPEEQDALCPERRAALQKEILACCQEYLPKHKVPALIRFLPVLDLTAGGKLARQNA
jgi:acyl-coenzyme A synthetase/AMP-(fatty) acid ligase